MDDETWAIRAEEKIQKDPHLWAHLLQIRNPGLPLIDSLPRPGDVIRTNESPCEVMVKTVIHTDYGECFECRVIHDGEVTHHKCYLNGYHLVKGRLLLRMRFEPGMTGYNIYSRGQPEIFVLRRARGQLDLFAY